MICRTPNRQTYTKKSYSWGDLRTLHRGISYTCIIHPQHMDAIHRQEAFTDDQNMRWQPTIADDIVTLRCGNYHFAIPLAELDA